MAQHHRPVYIHLRTLKFAIKLSKGLELLAHYRSVKIWVLESIEDESG